MQMVSPVCGGMDGQAAQRTACLRRVTDDGQSSTEWRDCGTTYDQRLAWRAWRTEHGGPIAILESPGVYWKPLDHVVVEPLAVVVAKAHSVRQRPGKKTEKAEAAWLAARFAPGLVAPSVLPPPAGPAWRDLTRTRVALVQTRPQGHNRLSKL